LPDLHDEPGFFLVVEKRGEGSRVVGRNAESPRERLFIQRLVIRLGQERTQRLAPVERASRGLCFTRDVRLWAYGKGWQLPFSGWKRGRLPLSRRKRRRLGLALLGTTSLRAVFLLWRPLFRLALLRLI
jgi:hypothetical protein